MKVLKCYLVAWSEDKKTGVACAPRDMGMAKEIATKIKDNVLPFDLEMKTVLETRKGIVVKPELDYGEGTVVDYQPNSMAWPLMSEKMKDIIERNLTGEEGVSWVKAPIVVKSNNVDLRLTYYVLRFTKTLDVLDKEKTSYVPGTDSVIVPRFDKEKIASLTVFTEPSVLWEFPPGFYVSEKLKKELQKEKVTGIAFEKASVV